MRDPLHHRTGPDTAGSAPGTRCRSSVDHVHPHEDRDRVQHHGAVGYAGNPVNRDGAGVVGVVAQDLAMNPAHIAIRQSAKKS